MTASKPVVTSLIAQEDQRLLTPGQEGRGGARSRFYAILALVLLAHAALLAYLLYRDRRANMQTAEIEETPIEVVVQPPEAPKPPPPPPPPEAQKKPPPPPPPKEEVEKPAYSAPRAPNEEKVETNRLDQKTQAPKAATPPQDGQKAPPQQASLPKEESKADTKEDNAAKPEEDKADAEALDKAKPKVATKPSAKKEKSSQKAKKPTKNLFASISGESLTNEMTFAKPTPKSPVYGGTEDVRYLAIVEGMIMKRVHQLPRLNHYQEGGQVAVYFHIDENGRVISQEILKKSGNPEIDRMAMNAVREASPFPPPPAVVPHGLVWGSSIDGQLPVRAMR